MTTLNRLQAGQGGVIEGYQQEDESVLRLGEMGLIPGQQVKVLKIAPLGDPIEVEIMNYRLCLRKSEASRIQVRPLPL